MAAGLICMIIGVGLMALAFNLYTPIDQLYSALAMHGVTALPRGRPRRG